MSQKVKSKKTLSGLTMKSTCMVMMIMTFFTGVLWSEEKAATEDAPQPCRASWQNVGNGFWYQQYTNEKSYQFRFVDVLAKTDEMICDHQKLAEALAQELGTSCEADRLPLERLSVNRKEEWIRFWAKGHRWHFNPPTGRLRMLPADIDPEPVLPAVIPSVGESDADAYLLFHNDTQYDAICYWIGDGERKAYGTILPGETREQHTFSGHLWSVETAAGFPLANVEAKGGRQPVNLTEPQIGQGVARNSGASEPWKGSVVGSIMTLQHATSAEKIMLTMTDEIPTGEIRSVASGEFVAVHVRTSRALTWRLYHILNGKVEPIDMVSR